MICLRSIINGNLKTDLSNYNYDLSSMAGDDDIIEVYKDYTLQELLWKREEKGNFDL